MSQRQQISDLFTNPPEKNRKGVKSHSQYLIMPDGIKIAIDVMLPADLAQGERLPTIMIMARYWRSMAMRIPNPPNKAFIGPREPIADDMLARGFAVVVVDGRGTGASTGVNRYPWSPEERADHAAVARWIMSQAWSSGNIAAVGISYEGSTAQYLLGSGVDGVKSAAPMEYEFDVYTDVALPGGIFNTAFIEQWNESNKRLDNNKTSKLFPWLARLFITGVRPVDEDRKSRAVLTQAIRDHQANTDVHAAISQITFRDDLFGDTGVTLDDFSVFSQRAAIEQSGKPVFIWGSWLDGTTADTVLRSFNTLSNPIIGVIGAWKHEMTAHGSPYLAPKSKPDILQNQQWDAVAKFFAQTLTPDAAPVKRTLFYYTLGEEAWKHTDTFPLPQTDSQTWYFQPQQGLGTQEPTDKTGSDSYTVDFNATTGITNRWHTQMAQPVIYKDRAAADSRLLTYTSAPLEHDMEITGYPVVKLFVASSEDDGAFFVYLEDVDEKGIVRYITEGQLRGIHRHVSSENPPYWIGMPHHTFARADAAPLVRGEFAAIEFGLHPTSVLIRRGHRIRIAIAGADKDSFARIPANTTPKLEISRSRIMASHIRLPVIPR